MHILLTGGAGFIGSNTLNALVKAGHSIVVIDDFNDYYNPVFKEENIAPFINNSSVKIYRGSITDFPFLQNIFLNEKFDAVIHLAARAGVRPSIANPKLYQEVNVVGSENLLELCKEHGIKKFIFASSSSVYGNQTKVPFSETDEIVPISPYAETKKSLELLAYSYHLLYEMSCIGLRFFTVYGEKGRPDMAPYLFTEKLLKGEEIQKFGDGSTRRDYTYIDDIVEGILRCLDVQVGYEIINLGNNSPVSLNEFIALLEKITGQKAKIKKLGMQPGDVNVTYADITKAKTILHWSPKTSLEEGLTKFVGWFRVNRLK
jgi:UDP-glucuronate 4-epimerase